MRGLSIGSCVCILVWWNCWGQIRKCGLVGGMSLGVRSEVSKVSCLSLGALPLSPACGWRRELSTFSPSCLHFSILGSNPLKPLVQWNHLLYGLPWPQCFIPAIELRQQKLLPGWDIAVKGLKNCLLKDCESIWDFGTGEWLNALSRAYYAIPLSTGNSAVQRAVWKMLAQLKML